jgi:branched-chain amino acid transport system permease protein
LALQWACVAAEGAAVKISARFGWVGLAALGVLALLLPSVASKHILTAAIVALQMSYLAQCWNIAAGYAGQFSLGHSVFLGIGGYTSTMLFVSLGLTPWLGMFAGALLAGLVGVLLALIVYRYNIRGVFFAVVTLGSMEVARGLAENWDFIKGPVGIVLTLQDAPGDFLFLSRVPFYYVSLAMVVLAALGTRWIEASRLGQYLLAIREDEEAAEASGIDTHRYKVVAIGLSAFAIAFAGTFYAQFYLYISPGNLFSFEPQLNMMLGAMVGGAGTAGGPILGAVLFSAIGEALRNLPFGEPRQIAILSKMIYAVLLILIVMYLPGGLIRLFKRSAR